MGLVPVMRRWFIRTGTEILGWILLPVGIIMLVAPGPGMLVSVAGLALLARHYSWASRLLEPVHRKAIEAAVYGVATWPRIIMSLLGVIALTAAGFFWVADPTIPEFTVFGISIGPELPLGGPQVGSGILISALLALLLLVYSVLKFRPARSES